MMGTIGLEEFRFACKIGVAPHELVAPRQLTADIYYEIDLTKAVASDALADTVSYAAVAEMVVAHVEGKEFHLMERLAHEILQLMFSRFAVISWASIRLRKPQKVARHSVVEMELFRDEDLL